MKYFVYTDGSTKNNGAADAVGGWAYAVVGEDNTLLRADAGSERGATNQRMEILGAIKALNEIEKIVEIPNDVVVLYTDSAYVHNCCKQKWYVNWQKNGWKNAKKEPVANRDLWERLIPYFDKFGYNFEKVKGHSNNSTMHEMWNNYIDDLAQTAAQKLKEQTL